MTGITNTGDGFYAITSATALTVTVANFAQTLGSLVPLDRLLFVDTVGKPHVFTFAAAKLAGGKTTISFSGTVGDFVEVKLILGLVYVLSSRGVTLL